MPQFMIGPRAARASSTSAPLPVISWRCASMMSTPRARPTRTGTSPSTRDGVTGYDGAFFTDPLIGRTPPAGLGVFWRSDVFELVEEQEDRVIACNTTTVSLSNHDLLEKWHPLVVPPTDGGGVTATDLPAADRRQAAVARLRHKASGRIVCVVAVHLMTTSRDGLA